MGPVVSTSSPFRLRGRSFRCCLRRGWDRTGREFSSGGLVSSLGGENRGLVVVSSAVMVSSTSGCSVVSTSSPSRSGWTEAVRICRGSGYRPAVTSWVRDFAVAGGGGFGRRRGRRGAGRGGDDGSAPLSVGLESRAVRRFWRRQRPGGSVCSQRGRGRRVTVMSEYGSVAMAAKAAATGWGGWYWAGEGREGLDLY